MSRTQKSSISDGRRAIIAGLHAIEHRGPDSTGVAWTRGKQEKVWYHKQVGPASKVAKRLDLDAKLRIHTAIGHCRYGTQGGNTHDNAHPVVADNIVLVHNGVLDNDDELVQLSGRKRVGQVDSWAMAGLLAAQSDLGAHHPTTLLELVEGDAAIMWLDANAPSMLHMARLAGRPLFIAWTKRGDLVASSTAQTLKRSAKAGGYDLYDITELPEGTYLRVEAGGIREWESFEVNYRRPQYRWSLPTPPAKATVGRGYAHGITDAMSEPAKVTSLVDRAAQRAAEAAAAELAPAEEHLYEHLYGNSTTDWWDDAEALLGDAVRDQ